MKNMKLLAAFVAAALIAGAAYAIPIPGVANPSIYGEWHLDLTVNEGAISPDTKGAAGDCVFSGTMNLTNVVSIKDNSDKISDPVSGETQMELVSGNCGDFFGEIQGNAFNNTIGFNLAVFPIGPLEKGDPLIVLVLDGQWINEELMQGDVTGAFNPVDKGASGVWVATRSRGPIPTLSPVGLLALLAGLGLVGGLALRRRQRA